MNFIGVQLVFIGGFLDIVRVVNDSHMRFDSALILFKLGLSENLTDVNWIFK